MRELRTEIEIAASTNKIWSILTDLERWGKWNPLVDTASGNTSLGSKLSITMRCEDGKDDPKYTPTITDFEKPKFFRWRATMMAGFLFTNDKIFELVETDSGTRLIHTEAFSGIFVPLFWGKLREGILPMLKTMNDALKIEAEKSPN